MCIPGRAEVDVLGHLKSTRQPFSITGSQSKSSGIDGSGGQSKTSFH